MKLNDCYSLLSQIDMMPPVSGILISFRLLWPLVTDLVGKDWSSNVRVGQCSDW